MCAKRLHWGSLSEESGEERKMPKCCAGEMYSRSEFFKRKHGVSSVCVRVSFGEMSRSEFRTEKNRVSLSEPKAALGKLSEA